jgi:HPt (histidine-containing phosphotransfer) domain-containing protein
MTETGYISYDLTELKEASQGDNDFVIEMIKIFMRCTSEGIKKMEEALLERNFTLISNIAHKIAPPCHHLGIEALLKTLKQIETFSKDDKKNNDVESLILQAKREINIVVTELQEELERV